MDKHQVCSICGVPFGCYAIETLWAGSEHLCARCLNDEFCFEKARAVASFDGLLRDLLHGFKYRGKIGLGTVLSKIFTSHIPDDLDFFNLILPVPIYISKLREREYNQSAILGCELSKALGCEYDPFTLKKIKDTPPQISLETTGDRKRNVRNFFYVSDVKKIRNKSVLLVDDVFTTGSTVNECSRVLLKAGATSVQVLTLMRADK